MEAGDNLGLLDFLLYNKVMSYNSQLLHSVVTELQGFRDGPAFTPSADIDMVWALAAPGTYYEPSQDGLYAAPDTHPDLSYDRCNVNAGIEVVQGVTAARLDKPSTAVTKDDIAAHGPALFYNGEDPDTAGYKYGHNEALKKAVESGDFPLPASNVAIDRIATGITPSQVEGYAAYREAQLQRGETPATKVAVAALFWHLPRVGRYLTHYQDRLPGVTFVPVPVHVPQSETAFGLVMGEARRVLAYHHAGHLARTSAFA
jgi:hypothetical protein